MTSVDKACHLQGWEGSNETEGGICIGDALSVDLELQTNCKLDQARVIGICRRGNLSIQRVTKRRRRISKLRCVEHVEGFCTEFQLQTLVDIEVLEKRQVHALESGAVKLVASLVAERRQRLRHEIARVEPACKCATRNLAGSGHIRPIGIRSSRTCARAIVGIRD